MAISEERIRVITATRMLLPAARRMPSTLRKNSSVPVETGFGKIGFGKARTFCGVLNAITVISQIGSRMKIAMAIATA